MRIRVPVLPVLGLVLLWAALLATVAWAESLQEKQYESAQAAAADCDTVAGGCHYLVLGGLTSGNVVTRLTTNASGELQVGLVAGSGAAADDGAFTFGTDLVLPVGYVFDDTQSNDPEENDVAAARIDSKRSQTFVMESAATRGLFAEVLTAGADATANTTNGVFTYSALQTFNGATYDRVDSVDTGALVSETCDSGSGSTLCADVQTAGADDVANTENGLWTYSGVAGFDEDDTNWDRVYSYDTDGENVATEAEGVTLAVTNFPVVYDLTGANFDRMSTGMVTGAGLPGANVQLGVDATSSCMAALSLGYYRITPVAAGQAIAYCCRSGTTCTAVTTDAPYLDGQYYYETVTDAAANDVICCINASGTNTTLLNATPLTF